jgi:hypothetical protein
VNDFTDICLEQELRRPNRILSFVWRCRVRLSLLTAAVLATATVASAAPITLMTVAAVPGGGVEFNNGVFGNEILMGYPGSTSPRLQPPTPSGLLEEFSFFWMDPGADAAALTYKTGIISTTSLTGSFIDPSNVIYESDWRTVQSDGSVHRLDTNVELLLPPGERLLFYIMTPGYDGPSGQLLTNRTLEMAIAGAPAHPEGAFGLRAGGGYADWTDPAAPGAMFSGFNYDGDLAMRLQVRSVPEPTSLLLLGLGSLGLFFRRR